MRIDGPLAVVTVDYTFYAGPRLSHCGIDAFQLFRGPEGWKIFQLTDTRRRTGCRRRNRKQPPMIRRKPRPLRRAPHPRAGRQPPVRRRGVRRSVAGALLLPVVVGGFALQAWGGRDGERLFHEVVSRVATRGLDSLSDAQLYEKAARGLLVQIGDPYADLFSPEQLAAFSREALRNSYTGVGMQITTVRDTATVTRVFTGSPAAAGGGARRRPHRPRGRRGGDGAARWSR